MTPNFAYSSDKVKFVEHFWSAEFLEFEAFSGLGFWK